jgi:FkbM family methyltransferase
VGGYVRQGKYVCEFHNMSWRHARNRLLQVISWSKPMRPVVRLGAALTRKFDSIILNYSLESETNGEYWLIEQLPPQPIVIDVGFYEGDFSRELLRRRPAARLYGFDPSRHAQRHFASHPFGDGRVTLVSVALADHIGTATFHDYGNMCNSLAQRTEAGCENGARYDVPVQTLDSWCLREGIAHIDFLKVDAEGFDLDVLKGSSQLLQDSAIDLIMFEYASGWISSRRFLQDAVEFLAAHSYKLFRLFNGFLAPFEYSLANESAVLRTCMYVAVSDARLGRGGISIQRFPA